MIGSLRGSVLERSLGGEVVLEVGGVGYRILVPTGSLAALEPGGPGFVFTHLHVREDAMVLYGFLTRDERDTFEALIGASGVGPKLALATLSVHSPNSLRNALAEDDLDSLMLVPGVGRRTAQRLLVDLKSRLDVPESDSIVPGDGARSEVRAALVELGYGVEEVRYALGSLGDTAGQDVAVMLRSALKNMGSGVTNSPTRTADVTAGKESARA